MLIQYIFQLMFPSFTEVAMKLSIYYLQKKLMEVNISMILTHFDKFDALHKRSELHFTRANIET